MEDANRAQGDDMGGFRAHGLEAVETGADLIMAIPALVGGLLESRAIDGQSKAMGVPIGT